MIQNIPLKFKSPCLHPVAACGQGLRVVVGSPCMWVGLDLMSHGLFHHATREQGRLGNSWGSTESRSSMVKRQVQGQARKSVHVSGFESVAPVARQRWGCDGAPKHTYIAKAGTYGASLCCGQRWDSQRSDTVHGMWDLARLFNICTVVALEVDIIWKIIEWDIYGTPVFLVVVRYLN